METKKNKKKEKQHMTIQEYIGKYGTPQRFLAKELKVSTTTINQIICKKRLPGLKLAKKIEDFTDGLVTLYDWEFDLAEDENSDIPEDKN